MKKLISMVLILAVLFSVSCAIAEREEGKTYSRLAVVVECEQVDNVYMVTCQDKDGNLWQFFDDENYWKICDLCNLLMFAYDDDFTHDEIIDVVYEGFLTPSACVFWLTNNF